MIEIRNLTKKRADTGIIKRIYKKLFHKKFELDVVLASPRLMLALNKKYRKKEKIADVLSFLLEKNIGEIFLNISKKNLPYLFIHGSLHLLGYKHKKNKDAKKMERKELNILKQSK
ncbi:MAG: rRNA maturation RNAse YbeY [Candidatus Giovannonibacteria bacterium]|nr:rRNA maturation RNAse YbeY [Candidatus Giovannonibacteria bacterium]